MSEQRLRVLHLIDTLGKGGAEKLLVDSVSEMLKGALPIEHFVCTLQAERDEFPLPASVRRLNLDLRRWNLPRAVLALQRFIRLHQIEVMHAHLVNSILLSRLVGGPTLHRKIFSYHNFYYDPHYVYYSWWRALLEKWSHRKDSISVYVSADIRRSVEALRGQGQASHVLYNFAHPSFRARYRVGPPAVLRVVMVTNLRATKNLELAIQELSLVRDSPIEVDIYGEGPGRAQLESLLSRASVSVFLKGRADITSELLSDYDLFLMTSKSEGLPVSLLESMTTGLPSVLPDHLAILQEVAGASAFFYSIERPGELARLLLTVLQDKSVLSVKSVAALEESKKYDVRRYLNHLWEIYTSRGAGDS